MHMISTVKWLNSRSDFQTIISASACTLIVLLLGWFLNIDLIKYNYSQATEFIFSAHFLFFATSGYLVCRKWISNRVYNFSIFILATSHSLLFDAKYLDIFRMAGDNICQIAYWNILYHQNLTGAIGASFTKPGQVLVLGLLNTMSQYGGPLVFKAGMSLVMAACIWSLVRIATDIGGRIAGVIVFPVSIGIFTLEFLLGSSSIFLIPSLFTGLWLYFYKPGLKTAGRILLVLSIQFHIHTIAVLAVIWLILAARRDWKELFAFSLYSTLSVVIWVATIFRVQGAWERLNSGVAVGYVSFFEGKPVEALKYMLNILHTGLVQESNIRLLMVLGVIGIIGAIAYGHKMYLSALSSVFVLIINVLILGGTFNLERYCSTFYAYNCAVGIATIVRYYGEIKLSGTLISKTFATLSILLLMVTFDCTMLNYNKTFKATEYADYPLDISIVNARNILSEPMLYKKSRLMTEDDIIFSVVVMDPDYFSSFTALQYFNVANESTRKKILANTDYIWIALNDYDFTYLVYKPIPEWDKDAFRMLIMEILTSNKPSSLYGYRFLPIDRNEDGLVLKVEHD